MPETADILENSILQDSPGLLSTLLKDHTTSRGDAVCNIFWATSDYEHLGKGYGYHDPILPELITGDNGQVIMPRVLKHKDTQSARVRDMAEVFTPAWVCNAQNNLIDEAWFGRKGVFNTEYTSEDGTHGWKTNPERISFPEGKAWKDYVRDTRLEITCGEAPYIVSRYDTTTGAVVPLADRIGLLDRKLRVASENTGTSGEWLEAAQKPTRAYMPTNGKATACLLPVNPCSPLLSNTTVPNSGKTRWRSPSTTSPTSFRGTYGRWTD